MKKHKITVHMGEGKLTAPGKLEVKGEKGSETLTAKNIIVATGARARDLPFAPADGKRIWRSEEHTSELQSLMRISYAVFCLKKKTQQPKIKATSIIHSINTR